MSGWRENEESSHARICVISCMSREEVLRGGKTFQKEIRSSFPFLRSDFSRIHPISSLSPFQKQIEGDLEKGIHFVGQVQGLIHDVPTVQALVTRVLAEAQAIHEKQHQELFRKSA